MATTRRRDEAARSSGNNRGTPASLTDWLPRSELLPNSLFPDDLAASSRRRVVAIAREARPMDLRTRPVWSVRAMRRLMKRPAPRACVEAPVAPTPTGAAALQAQSAPTQAQGAPAGAVPAVTPRAPVRVGAMPPPPPRRPTPATPAATAAGAPASGPARTPTAPLKNGRPYDWTGLP